MTINASHTNFGQNAEKARQEVVSAVKAQYGLHTAQEAADALGMNLKLLKFYYYKHRLFQPSICVRGVNLFDVDVVRVSIERHRASVSEKRSETVKANRALYLSKKGGAKPPVHAQVLKPKPEPVKVIPTKTPIVSTPKPKPIVAKANLRAPANKKLQQALTECWNLDRSFSRQNWREIVKDYDRQGKKRK